MKLTYFEVKDYRSLSRAVLDNLQTAAILIGPNNEGKSNILQGLKACLTLLREGGFRPAKDALQMSYDNDTYNWRHDYPIDKQQPFPLGESVFILKFNLSPTERTAFRKKTGSYLSEALPLELRFNPHFASFRVKMQGRASKALSNKREKICEFVNQTLDYVYIPPIRTAETSQELVSDLVFLELRQLERNPSYIKVFSELDLLQSQVSEKLSKKLKENLSKFLGASLKEVQLKIPPRKITRMLSRNSQIIINDGTPTVLERKGDGVQSLVAISLMIGALEESGSEKDIIMLIEEPESHLHPKAIHQLREVLEELRRENQVIVSTHCPLFVNRANVASNFVVTKNKATPAQSLDQIRKLLGVRISDNLRHAALVIVLEGAEDEKMMHALLSHYSPSLQEAISKGALAFEILGGASKLTYALSQLRTGLCNYLIFLDDDKDGRDAYRNAGKDLLSTPSNTTFTKCQEIPEAEFEDLLNPDLYAPHFLGKYCVDVTHQPFKSKAKWSKRIRAGMEIAGKDWPESLEFEDKRAIASLVEKEPDKAIHSSKVELIRSFATTVEKKLIEISMGLRH